MQHLSAYLMEAPDLSDEEGKALYKQLEAAVDEWLRKKGMNDPTAVSSTFVSKMGGQPGMVRQIYTANDQGELREVFLEEPTDDGNTFRTALRVVRSSLRTVVYITLAARNGHSVIRPGFVVPRCPEIVHKIRELRNDWHLGDTKLGSSGVRDMPDEADGIALATSLYFNRRRTPIVVVSTFDGDEYWPGLARQAARDLDALATVYRLGEDASWGLTDEVGKKLSCYGGAVRLYWPPIRDGEDVRITGRVWTAARLDFMDRDGKGFDRLRSDIRMLVMSAAAVGVEPPFEIGEIRTYRARMRMQELEQRGQSAAKELEIAKAFYDENADLREEVEALRQVIAQMKGGYQSHQEDMEAEEDVEADAEEDFPAPVQGDIRFYKKTYATPKYDVMVRRGDCGHDNWQPAHSADKAWKGIKRLEGRDDWSLVNHCATCEGGGMWRVRW
jgi:hypothetical protein